MSLILHGAILSPFVRKIRLVLAEKGLEYEGVHADPFRLPEHFEQLNPLRRIPVLQDGDVTLADSAVIAAYLERRHPSPALYPQDPEQFARALWFEKYADYELAPLTTFTVFRQRIVHRLRDLPIDEERIHRAVDQELPPLFDYLNRELEGREFLAGDALSVADLALVSQIINYRHGSESVDTGRWPALAAHTERMLSRDSLQAVLPRETAFIASVQER